MGLSLQQDHFTREERKAFQQRLHQQIEALPDLLTSPGFSAGPASLGAELEMYLVDEGGCPKPVNQQLMELMQHEQLQAELNQFNLEFNLAPVAAKGQPFAAMETELRAMLDALQQQATSIDTRLVLIGILPTLEQQHLAREYMTDIPRYRALTTALSGLRGESFNVDIHGEDSLQMQCDEVTLEGANTSFQVHLKTPADRFKDLFNAAQLVTPLVLALSGNSPLLMGQQLWHETRIALFKQSIDSRIQALTPWRQPARVCFGHGWVRDGAWELFAENVALYPPILPHVSAEQSPFAELCLHHGTVWSWNRAVLAPGENGHLRIEFRALPAGPTVTDMLANAALIIGWTMALADEVSDMIARLPFEFAEYNFYRAAQSGLDAQLLWPMAHQNEPTERIASDIIAEMLPRAIDGLRQLDVAEDEISRLFTVLEERLASRQTGAAWQLKTFLRYRHAHDQQQALHLLLDEYMENMAEGAPVSQWKS